MAMCVTPQSSDPIPIPLSLLKIRKNTPGIGEIALVLVALVICRCRRDERYSLLARSGEVSIWGIQQQALGREGSLVFSRSWKNSVAESGTEAKP